MKKSLREFTEVKSRRLFIQKETKTNLLSVGIYPKDLEIASLKNCENMIGAVQIPLGVAGPLKIKGSFARGECYLPLATTEAALVASVNRGCKAVGQSSGVNVFLEDVGITRGPVFKTKSLAQSFSFKKWLEENYQKLQELAKTTSSHLRLNKFDCQILGRNVFVRFYFTTDDAMGMNMATYASQRLVTFIESQTGIICLSLAGNFDIDKKPAHLNFILGRGKKVWAEATIKKEIIRSVLKTTPEKIHELCLAKCQRGSTLSGSLGANAHFANIISAIFIACGQDAAHIVEGSLGITSTELINGDLYINVYLPDLVVGTVGGGTGLPSQNEALQILGVAGGNNGVHAKAFAEIIAGAVLAGELSLLASLSEGSLARAHKKLSGNIKL